MLITSQKYGYTILEKSFPYDWEPLFNNLNDDTIEGIRHKHKPFFRHNPTLRQPVAQQIPSIYLMSL